MKYLIGIGLTILGGVLTVVPVLMPLSIVLVFVGVFMFASFPSDAKFVDYRMANSDEVLLRKRYYIHFLPFTILSYVLTLGKATLKIVVKEEYFRTLIGVENENDWTKLSRKEYIALRDEQRAIYSTQVLSKEFMESSYSTEFIGVKRKKTRLIAASVLAGITFTTLTVPGGIFSALIFEAVFVPMIVLWIPEYKDAKILQQAYDRAVNSPANINIP